MTSDCLPHQAELPTERESRDVMHEDEPLPGSVRPENEALLIRQDVLGTAPRPEMQRAQRRAILGLMFFLSVVGFIFILVIHSVKHRGGSSSSGGGAGGGAGADADIGSNSKKHRPARSCNGPSHPPPQDSMHEVDKEAELPAEPPVWSTRPRSPRTAMGVSYSTSPADAWVTPRAQARAPGGATSAARRGGGRSLQV